MTDITDRVNVPLYYDGRQHVGSVTVEIDAETTRREWNEEMVDTVERVRETVKRELQTVQDELGEEGGDPE